jgi:hypothetical protein
LIDRNVFVKYSFIIPHEKNKKKDKMRKKLFKREKVGYNEKSETEME